MTLNTLSTTYLLTQLRAGADATIRAVSIEDDEQGECFADMTVWHSIAPVLVA